MKGLTQRRHILAPLAMAVVAILLYWMAQTRVTLAVMLGGVFSLTIMAAYIMASLEKGRGSGAAIPAPISRVQPATPRAVPAATAAVAFRVTGARGHCTLGRRVGDLIEVGGDGRCSPGLCSAAESALRVAAKASDADAGQQWCCPVYDHLLVFKRMAGS